MTELKFPVKTVDLSAALTVFLPKSLELPDGSTQSIVWVDADEDHASLQKPFGTFSVKNNRTATFIDKNAGSKAIGVNQVDNITYTTGTDDYTVSEQDIKVINSVDGTVASAPYTFVEDTDFEVINAPTYATPNTIRFIPGGAKPDNGTTVVVDYDHLKVESQMVNKWNMPVVLALHVDDSHNTYKPKTAFAEILMQGLTFEVFRLRGSRVAQGVRFGATELFLPADFDGGEQTIRVSLQARLHFHQLGVESTYERIGFTDYTFDADI